MNLARDYPVFRCSFCYGTWSYAMHGPECPDCGGFSVSAVVSELQNLESEDA